LSRVSVSQLPALGAFTRTYLHNEVHFEADTTGYRAYMYKEVRHTKIVTRF